MAVTIRHVSPRAAQPVTTAILYGSDKFPPTTITLHPEEWVLLILSGESAQFPSRLEAQVVISDNKFSVRDSIPTDDTRETLRIVSAPLLVLLPR